MTDEELRTFCVEQAVLILSNILYNYIRTGEQSFIPASLSYLKKNNTDLFINN